MSRYAVAHLDEIEEISDGRCPSRPIRSGRPSLAFTRPASTPGRRIEDGS